MEARIVVVHLAEGTPVYVYEGAHERRPDPEADDCTLLGSNFADSTGTCEVFYDAPDDLRDYVTVVFDDVVKTIGVRLILEGSGVRVLSAFRHRLRETLTDLVSAMYDELRGAYGADSGYGYSDEYKSKIDGVVDAIADEVEEKFKKRE